jgi:hypothetical protein
MSEPLEHDEVLPLHRAKNELDSLDGLAERVNWLLPVSRRDVNARNVPDFES